MIYTDLTSFFEMEVSSHLGKKILLDTIASAEENKAGLMEQEGNVYKIIIIYSEGKVEIWDTIVSPIEQQEPYTSTLKNFIRALEAYVPMG